MKNSRGKPETRKPFVNDKWHSRGKPEGRSPKPFGNDKMEEARQEAQAFCKRLNGMRKPFFCEGINS
jgi:hypothetical protein